MVPYPVNFTSGVKKMEPKPQTNDPRRHCHRLCLKTNLVQRLHCVLCDFFHSPGISRKNVPQGQVAQNGDIQN